MSDQVSRGGEQAGPRAAWMQRVLGLAVASAPPARGPSNALRNALSNAVKRAQLPDSDDELPDLLTTLAPGFLATALNEPEMSDTILQVGQTLPPMDRMTEIGAMLDLLGRRLDAWNAALDEAEQAKKWLEGASKDAPEYQSVLTTYDESRNRGADIMAEVQALAQTLRKQCEGLKRAEET